MSKSFNDIQESEGAIENMATFRNYRGIINKLNDHYGLEKEIVHYDFLIDKATELPEVCCLLWEINNTDALKQKMGSISSIITRAIGTPDHRVKRVTNTVGKNHSVVTKLKFRDIPDWNELQPKLREHGKEQSIRGIIALAFSYGYVLRVGEFFDTKIGDDDGINNFLDPVNLRWTIRLHKNGASGVVREFDVSQEFIDALPRKSGWLLRKKNGLPYQGQNTATRTIKYHGWWMNKLPSNRDIRASFETWNLHEEGRSPEQMAVAHEVLGHTKATAHKYYDKTLMPVVPAPPKKIKPAIKLRVK
jgi:hypothetical protein